MSNFQINGIFFSNLRVDIFIIDRYSLNIDCFSSRLHYSCILVFIRGSRDYIKW